MSSKREKNNDYKIIINNKKIWDFYDETKLDIEEINLLFINLFEKTIPVLNKDSIETVLKSQADNFKEIKNSLENINTNLVLNNNMNIQTIKDFLQNINLQIQNVDKDISLKFDEFKNQYVNDLKMLLQENNYNNYEKSCHQLEKNTEHLIDKMKLMLIDVDNNIVKQLSQTIKTETKQIFENNNTPEMINNFSKNIEKKINEIIVLNEKNYAQDLINKNNEILIEKMQLYLLNSLSKNNESLTKDLNETFINVIKKETGNLIQNTFNSETLKAYFENIEKQILKIEDIVYSNKNTTEIINSSLKMDNSTIKGMISENMLGETLLSIFSTGDVIHTGKTKESGDFIIYRENKPSIIIENKFYENNVPLSEIQKFHHDMTVNKMSGIFISQKHGISNKNNFQIDIINGLFAVYLHSCNNDSNKIKTAVNIIDYMTEITERLKPTTNDNDENINTINNITLEKINQEFNNLITAKTKHIASIKTLQKETNKSYELLIKETEDMTLNSLNDFLQNFFQSNVSLTNEFSIHCQYCNKTFNINNKNKKASLSAHYRGCQSKKEFDSKKEQQQTNI